MRLRTFPTLTSLFLGPFVAASLALASESDPIQLRSFQEHSRLSFRIDEGVQAKWTDTAAGFEVFFPNVGIADFGVPIGSEEAWIRSHGQLADSRLASLTIRELPGGVKVTGKWKFPGGAQALAHPQMEKFSYRLKSPAQFVIDFWPKSGETLAQAKAARKRAELQASAIRAKEEAKRRQERRIASAQAKAELEDVTRFCREPLSERSDVFLSFLPSHEKFDFTKYFPTTTPDSSFPYFEPKGDDEEGGYVRLALKLYRDGQYALAIRTLDFFDQHYPKSGFRPDMKFLRANALIKLGHDDQAFRILEVILVESRDTPVALHSGMFLAAKKLQQKNNLGALESFLWLSTHHSKHRLNWVFRMGTAESLFALGQTGRAAKEYQWVMENAVDRSAQAEAALRIGDLYLQRLQYDQALAGYFQGIRLYPAESKNFLVVHLNRAESLYGLAQYDRAEQAFREFLTEYPNHPTGWKATFRLSEIFGRRTGEAASRESRRWLYETVNRYPFSPGATLARSRLIPCGDHGGLDLAAAERFFAEDAMKFDGAGDVSMDRYRDFRGLARLRSTVTLGSEDQAVEVAIQELQGNPKSEARLIIGGVLEALFRKAVLAKLAQGKKYEAINFYHQKATSLPAGVRVSEPDYLLKLSQAASDLGLGGVAEQFAKRYDAVAQASGPGLRAPASGTHAPSTDIDDLVKRSEESFTQAKALWMKSGAGEVEQIRKLLSQVNEESPFSYEREIILGLLDDQSGKSASALGHALRAQLLGKGDPRLTHWVAVLQAKAGDSRAAAKLYRDLQKEKTVSDPSGTAAVLGVAPVPTIGALVLAEGEILAKQGRWEELAEAYGRAADDGIGGNQVLYEYARVLGRSAKPLDRERARATLEKVSTSDQDDFWRKLAREALANRDAAKNNAKEGMK